MKSHFRHFCRGFRETQFSAKMPILALNRPAVQGSETAKLPAQRQNFRQIQGMAFPAKAPIFYSSLMKLSREKLPPYPIVSLASDGAHQACNVPSLDHYEAAMAGFLQRFLKYLVKSLQ
ncbi:hypothetical protein [Halomonas sp. RA08-2]|uniref:hypothetical protein n=1 Tax=Halomonas sp. RA08-2 TaxID=3440842 RepID=UPI003EEDEC73